MMWQFEFFGFAHAEHSFSIPAAILESNMAEWGKGDDRWIVDERQDGQNVNQWHWSEKDCINWTRQRMAQLFDGVVLAEAGAVSSKVTGLDKVEGEAFLNIRKKKLIPSYELKVILSFEGSADGEGVSGKVRQLACVLLRGMWHVQFWYVTSENCSVLLVLKPGSCSHRVTVLSSSGHSLLLSNRCSCVHLQRAWQDKDATP